MAGIATLRPMREPTVDPSPDQPSPGGLPGWRLWLRAAVRRPGRALALVLGLVVMHVATVAALVGGAALETLFIADAEARFGPVDIAVVQPGQAVMSESLARFAGNEAGGVLAANGVRLDLDAVAAGPDTGPDADPVPDTRVLGISAEDVALGPLDGDGRLDVLALGPDEVVVNRRLAERAALDVGDTLELAIAVPAHTDPDEDLRTIDARVTTWTAQVAGIAEDAGLADDGRTANVLTRLDTLQRVTDLQGLVSALLASIEEPGRDAADDAVEVVAGEAGRLGVVAVPVKADAMDIATDEGGLFSGILLTLALLVVLAAVAVTANLVVLLGQERGREVALLRAVGARAATIRRLFTLEVTAYGLLAAVVGVVLAMPLADLLAGGLADHFASIESGRGRELVELDLVADPGVVATGVVVVMVVVLATARAAARRLAQVDVAAVLRGAPARLPAPRPGARRAAGTNGAGLLLLGMGLTAEDGADLLLVLGLTLLLIAWWLRRRGRPGLDPAARSVLDERAAMGGVAWSVRAPPVFGDFTAGVQASFGILVLAGAGAVGCAAVLASSRAPALMRAVRTWLPDGPVQVALRTAGAQAAEQRLRSGLVMGTIGVVLFMVAALAVLGAATDIGADRQRGGFDVVGTAPVAVDDASLAEVEGVASLVGLEHTVMAESWFATVDADDARSDVPWPVRTIRVTPDLPAAQRFGVLESAEGLATSRQVLEAVVRGEGVAVDRYARPEGAQVGDDVVIDDGRGPVRMPLLAVLDTFVLQGVLLGGEDHDRLFPRNGTTLVLATAADGQDPALLARDLGAAAADRGLTVRTIADVAEQVVAVNRAFTDIFAVMLRLGLVVALVAVAVLAARGVRERRRHLAVLRAIGLRRRHLRLLLLAEPLLQAVVGAVLGLGLGLAVLWLLFTVGFADLAFAVSWVDLVGTAVGVVLLVGVVCLVPARSGVRTPLDVGLRDRG